MSIPSKTKFYIFDPYFDDYTGLENICQSQVRNYVLWANEEEYKVGYMLYLQALLAINIRKGSFDSGVRRKIIKSIKEFYQKYKDKIDAITFDEVMDGYYDYKVSYKKGILHIYLDGKACFFDYKNCYAEYTDHVELKIQGSVLNKLNEEERIMYIHSKMNMEIL